MNKAVQNVVDRIREAQAGEIVVEDKRGFLERLKISLWSGKYKDRKTGKTESYQGVKVSGDF